jgi:hypothetical protein
MRVACRLQLLWAGQGVQQGGITFSGKSGEKYYFQVWPLETRFRSVAAVYFVTKRVHENNNYRRAGHEEIYIGQTGDLTAPFASQSQLDCFRKHGANCICIYPAESEARRLAVEQDLIAFHHTSCN